MAIHCDSLEEDDDKGDEERGEDSTGPGQKPQVGDTFHSHDILDDFSSRSLH